MSPRYVSCLAALALATAGGVQASDMSGNWRIEVVDLDGRRIDKLLVQKIARR